MGDQSNAANDDFRQGLEEAFRNKFSELYTSPRTSENDLDLEALRSIVEGTGSCRFKVKEWADPISLSANDEKTQLLQMFLLLLWQSNRLTHMPFDPLDLKITKRKGFKPTERQEDSVYTFTEEMSTNWKSSGAPLDLKNDPQSEEEGRIQLAEDLPEHLIGPKEVDLKRKDDYHSLFSTYHKSTDLRKQFFLESKHISHVRKLSGLDIYDYGYKFNKAVLEKTATSLEELDVGEFRDIELLNIVKDLSMPKLRRFNIWLKWIDEEMSKSSLEFAPPAAGHSGLRWLRARLPRKAIESLLRANGKTLLELHVDVGTPRGPDPQCRPFEVRWPLSCEDLDVMLVRCGVVSLRRLVLSRGGNHHTRASCAEQARAVRRALPGVIFECEFCRPG